MGKNYMDISLSPKERAELLLAELDTEEKLLQLSGYMPLVGDKEDTTAKLSFEISLNRELENFKQKFPKGVGHISTLTLRECKSLHEAAKFQRKFQAAVMEKSRHHIPAIFHMEGVCGAYLKDAASFPVNMARGAAWDIELEEKIGRIVARQERCMGITQTLAPVLDVTKDPRLGRCSESYSEDATLVSALGSAYTKGIQESEDYGRKSDAVAKHFLGSHIVQAGIHGTNADIPERQLYENYAKPFQAAIKEAGLKGIMPCYCNINGEPVSSSEKILTRMLRGEMGFDGLVVSDYSAVGNIHTVQHVYETMAEAGAYALNAGMDVELPNTECYGKELLEIIEKDEKLLKKLDESVSRVLEAKFRMGLFEYPFSMEDIQIAELYHRPEDNEVMLQSAREGIVLIKNDSVLPLKKNIKKIALIGSHADNPRVFFGDYTHISMASAVLAVANSIAGIGEAGTKGNSRALMIPGTQVQSDETEEFMNILRTYKPEVKSLFKELQGALPDIEINYSYGYPVAGVDKSGYEEALDLIREADLAVLTLGGRYCSCSVATQGEGVDSTNVNLPECQEQFIKEAAALGKPLVGVHMSARPVSSDAADKYLDAIVEAWTLSEKGPEAICDVLSGKYNPSGKLPVSVVYHVGQIPITYNHLNGSAWHQGASIGFSNYVDMPHTPRYVFGHGLSYTTFAYSNLVLNKKEVSGRESIKISFAIENTGTVTGTEIAQLYLIDTYAGMARPVKELAGFARVELAPGEKKQVTMEIDTSQTAFLDAQMKWKIEKGEICVEVGASSEDIRLKSSFQITENEYIDGAGRIFYAKQIGVM